MKQPVEFRTAITILLAVLILAIGFLWYGFNRKNGINLPTTSIATTTSQSVVSGVNTSNWKTYTNQQYGFSFQYPPDYSVSVDTSQSLPQIEIDSSSTQEMKQGSNGESSDAITVSPGYTSQDLNGAYSFPLPIFPTVSYFKSSGINYLGNVTTTDGHLGFEISDEGEGEYKDTFFQSQDGTWIDVQTEMINTSTAIEPYDTILSTFQFTSFSR